VWSLPSSIVRTKSLQASFPGWGLDGAVLHSQQGVPPERWCVTKEDLRHFRRCIKDAIRAGVIKPIRIDPATGKGDPFDPADEKVGPSMYNVVNSYIKPLTEEAGNLSWALLRHPGGLKCDIFITHSWAEGAFELTDKVIASWPPGKTAAWCCIFANPQNLDICQMICEPRTSPFAKALKCATHMMAVSNSKLSIYTRIWCVYEAYLAYKWDKTIFTAVAPDRPERLWAAARMLMSLAAGTLTALALIWWGGHTALSSMLQPFQTPHIMCFLGPDVQAIVSVVLACFSQSMLQPGLAWRSINMFGVASTSMSVVFILCLAQEGHWALVVMTGPAKLLLRMLLPLLLVFFILSEVDCLRLARAHREADQLAVYSCVTGAESSNEEDKRAILSDIGDKVDAVNKSIHVLLDAGMSTLGLRSAAELGVDVAGAAEQRLAVGWAGLSKWCLFTVFFCTELGDHNLELLGEARYNRQLPQLYHKAEFYLTACCIVCYAIIWVASGTDKKAFLLSALFKLLVLMTACFPLVVIVFNCLRKGRCSCAWSRMWESRPWGLGSLYAALFSILAVLCAARGLSGLARIPCIGRHLAGALAPGCRICKCCGRRAAKRSRGPSTVIV